MSDITERIRILRKNQTPAEKLLWEQLRYEKLGVKFRRQYPIIFYLGTTKYFIVADFFCKEKWLVVEVDGKIHQKQQEHDRAKDTLVKDHGYTILRITNEEILQSMPTALDKIQQLLN